MISATTMSLKLLKDINKSIRKGTATVESLCQQINTHELHEYVTQEWVDYIKSNYIQTLSSNEFWKKVTSIDDFNAKRDEWRFFPVDGKVDDVKVIAKKVFLHDYPNWTETKVIRSANGKWVPDWMKTGTNYALIPVSKPDLVDAFNLSELLLVLETVKQFPVSELYVKILYAVCINYTTCGLVVHNSTIVKYIGEILTDTKYVQYADIIRHALFYSMYILKHEETICRQPTVVNRFVLTLDEAVEIQKYHALDSTRTSPLLVMAPIYGSAHESYCPYYLKGERRLVSLDEFHRRFDLVVDPAIRRLQKWKNVAVVGSTLVSCIADNKLNDSPQYLSQDLDDELAEAIRPLTVKQANACLKSSDDSGFIHRHNTYYPVEGDQALTSDLDIAVHCDTGFDNQVFDMIAEINRGQSVPYEWRSIATYSSFKYQVTHPITKLKLEIFKSPRAPMDMVSSYHMPCVRMYYDFRQVYMTRSCASALITGINENYNWFSSNKNPMDIVLKYAQRGFTTRLNIKELQCINEFMRKSDRWSYIQTTNDDDNYSHFTGQYDCQHMFFRIDGIAKGIRLGLPDDKNIYYDTRNLYRDNNKDRTLKYQDMEFERYDDYCLIVPPQLPF